jgi:glycine cleavage system aminomethyltransferase T
MARAPGRVIYSAMLNERGGFESDLTALRLDHENYRLYVGTAAIKRDLAWLKRNLKTGEQVLIQDQTEAYAVLGLMGPLAASIADRVGATEPNALKYFSHCKTEIGGLPGMALT